MSDVAVLMDVSSSVTTDAPNKLELLSTATPSNGTDSAASATGAPSSSAAPPTDWPLPSALLLPSGVWMDGFPYVTFDEAAEPVDAGDDDEDEHWLQVAFSSSSAFSSSLSRAPTSTALSIALAHMQKQHRQFVQQNSLSSPAWQSLKEHTAHYLLDCDRARALPITQRPCIAAADVAPLGAGEAAALNPLLAPCTPPMPPFRRPLSSSLPPAKSALSMSEEDVVEAGSSRKRRRLDDGAQRVMLPPSQRLVTGALGSHVLRLLHIAQLKDGITREHSALLQGAIDRKQRSNALILQRQQQQLLERQQQPSTSSSLPPPTSSAADPHVAPPSAAVNGAPVVASRPPSPSTERPMLRSAAATGRLKAFIAGLPSDAAAGPPKASPNSHAQLLALLPPILAVHFLHCGFSTFSQCALQVMAEAAIDFIRTAGKALRHCKDDRRRSKPRIDGVKPEPINGKTEKDAEHGHADTAEESMGRRVLHQLRVGSEVELRRWYADRVLGAGARLKATEARLMELQRWVTSPDADPFHVPNDQPDSSEARAAMFSCEPFSPLRTLLSPPTLPATPPPLEDDREEPPPLDKVKDDAAMVISAAAASPSDAALTSEGSHDSQPAPPSAQPPAEPVQPPLLPLPRLPAPAAPQPMAE